MWCRLTKTGTRDAELGCSRVVCAQGAFNSILNDVGDFSNRTPMSCQIVGLNLRRLLSILRTRELNCGPVATVMAVINGLRDGGTE